MVGLPRHREVLGAAPLTLYALTGALRLAGPITAPVVAASGPAMPYVIPRLLAPPDARAVLSSLPVGEHTTHMITYFAVRDHVRARWERLPGVRGHRPLPTVVRVR